MLKVVLLGAGDMAQFHIGSIRSTSGKARLVGVADIQTKRAFAAVERWYAPFTEQVTVYEQYTEMLDELQPDIAIISLPHYLHCEAAVACLSRNINVLLEKPIAISVQECDSIKEALQKSTAQLMMGHSSRYMQESIWLKNVIQKNTYGRLLSLQDYRVTQYYQDRPAWFLDKNKAGGGILMNLGMHSLDRILWLTGQNPQILYAKVEFSEAYPGIDDVVSAFMCSQSGIMIDLQVLGRADRNMNRMKIVFEHALVDVDCMQEIRVYTANSSQSIRLTQSDMFVLQWNDFLQMLDGRIQNPIPLQEGVQAIVLAQRIYNAAACGLPITQDEVGCNE